MTIPRVRELAAGLYDHQREAIIDCNVLVDPFGFRKTPTELGRAVMDFVRTKAKSQKVEGT